MVLRNFIAFTTPEIFQRKADIVRKHFEVTTTTASKWQHFMEAVVVVLCKQIYNHQHSTLGINSNYKEVTYLPHKHSYSDINSTLQLYYVHLTKHFVHYEARTCR